MFKTNAIILKNVPYGETSLVVTAFTELFGVQHYMVNGVRTSKKGSNKAALYSPANVVQLEAYHNNKQSLQRIKDISFKILPLHNSIVKHSIALFFVEILYKLLKQPEENTDLFHFCEDIFTRLNDANGTVVANLPLFFCLHVTEFFGLKIEDLYDEEFNLVDLEAGTFTNILPQHDFVLQEDAAYAFAHILRSRMPEDLNELHLNQQKRRQLLHALMDYYSLHIADFTQPKSLKVLETVLEE
jgi:DNA repair protein RecO (recombination protein O)